MTPALTNIPVPVQIDLSFEADQIIEVVDTAPPPTGPVGKGEIDPIYYLGELVCDASETMARLPLRTYTILTKNGPAPVCAAGQLLESDADLFRLYKWECQQKICVGLFDRREVIGLFEVPPAPVGTSAA